MNDNQRDKRRTKDSERKRMQLQGMNEEHKTGHRSQKRDHVRAHRQRQLDGLREAITQIVPISINNTNHSNYQ